MTGFHEQPESQRNTLPEWTRQWDHDWTEDEFREYLENLLEEYSDPELHKKKPEYYEMKIRQIHEELANLPEHLNRRNRFVRAQFALIKRVLEQTD